MKKYIINYGTAKKDIEVLPEHFSLMMEKINVSSINNVKLVDGESTTASKVTKRKEK